MWLPPFYRNPRYRCFDIENRLEAGNLAEIVYFTLVHTRAYTEQYFTDRQRKRTSSMQKHNNGTHTQNKLPIVLVYTCMTTKERVT